MNKLFRLSLIVAVSIYSLGISAKPNSQNLSFGDGNWYGGDLSFELVLSTNSKIETLWGDNDTLRFACNYKHCYALLLTHCFAKHKYSIQFEVNHQILHQETLECEKGMAQGVSDDFNLSFKEVSSVLRSHSGVLDVYTIDNSNQNNTSKAQYSLKGAHEAMDYIKKNGIR
ncbi:hypothetical protein D5018_19980 [Parashewanella curva]|uniref:Uncharacterized protein n=1 Tax=Parashewanella curva TaxID=2338552 RepID=A0A3L8PRD6_9GAMM|nr:hypothetical protein [Parashewanella curva]RLV57935.1 hypothetical protein D5018_19980 [Parashewanella curva]